MIDLEQVFQGRVLCSPVVMTDFKQIFQGHIRSSHPVVFYKKSVLLKTSQNSLENSCTSVSCLNKVAGLRPTTSLKQSVSCFNNKLLTKKLNTKQLSLSCNKDHITYVIVKKYFVTISRSSHPEVLCKKGVLRNFAKFRGKHLRQSLFLKNVAGQACNFIKKETLAQVFSCEFCKISKNIFSYRIPPVAAFE